MAALNTRRMVAAAVAGVFACAGGACAQSGVKIVVTSSGLPTLDALIESKLESFGHQVDVVANHGTYDGATLANYTVLYLQPNWNWTTPVNPTLVNAIQNYVCSGGGLVTSEWAMWAWGNQNWLDVLSSSTTNGAFTGTATVTFTKDTAEPTINAGVPASFTMPVTSFAGTETFLTPEPGSAVWYKSDSFGPGASSGLAGWEIGNGRVANFSTTNGEAQWNDANFAKLASNVMEWASGAGSTNPDCYADCDDNGVLNIFDYICFGNSFSSPTPGGFSADCDCNESLNIFDYICYGNLYALGC